MPLFVRRGTSGYRIRVLLLTGIIGLLCLPALAETREEFTDRIAAAYRSAEKATALRALFHLDGVDAESLAMYDKRIIPRMLGKLKAPSIAFEPLPDEFDPVYVRDGFEYRPNIKPAGFVVLNTRTKVLYGVRDGRHYFPGVTRVLVVPGAAPDRLVQMMVVGMATPPVRFAGHCDIMQSNGALKRMALESNDSGNQTVALMAQHIVACHVTNASARGTLWLRLQEGEAVVFDKRVSAPVVAIDFAR